MGSLSASRAPQAGGAWPSGISDRKTRRKKPADHAGLRPGHCGAGMIEATTGGEDVQTALRGKKREGFGEKRCTEGAQAKRIVLRGRDGPGATTAGRCNSRPGR